MEEMMMVMMNIRSHGTSPNNNLTIPITTTAARPTWKLYENPFYTSHLPNNNNHQEHGCTDVDRPKQLQIHKLNLPVSARKIAASFWDLTFIKPFMLESELETARHQIGELRAELESERKARKKMESLNRRLARQLSEERRGREALEKVCEELAGEVSGNKAEINRMRREMDDERKMLRTAEVIREERVQMKLAEARMLMEEKLSELEVRKRVGAEPAPPPSSSKEGRVVGHDQDSSVHLQASFGEKLRFVNSLVQRKGSSPEAENPHIRRGIKGFVEFPKVVRAIGCRSSKHLGTKLECQKAQLKILLKQKGPAARFNGLIAS